MMFPVDPEKEGGPPYAVSPELYTELLTPVGECGLDLRAGCSACMTDWLSASGAEWAFDGRLQHLASMTMQQQSDGISEGARVSRADADNTSVPAAGFTEISVEKVPEELSHPGREGKEFLGRWRKQ
jgi:hypothetical protein